MLQIPSAKPLAEFKMPRSTAMSLGDLIASFVSLARRRLGVLILIFCVSLLCGVVYLYVAPPGFMAKAELLIDTKKAQPFPQQQSSATDLAMDSAAVDSQIQVLKSENVATRRITSAFTSEGRASTPAVIRTRPPVIVVRKASFSSRMRFACAPEPIR